MSKQKFYAIKRPEGGQIVDSWEVCEPLVRGEKGIKFKSFSTKAEAEAWLNGSEATEPDGIRVYVDGSFTPSCEKAGWAFVVIENGKEIARGSGFTAFPAESRNIDGECMASYQAMRWLDLNDKYATICHDYEGIARWARGEWKAKSHIAMQYVAAVKPYLFRVNFEKVAAHTGVKWNELVDSLAKEAVEKAKKVKEGKSA
ncbi:viroplasmin family protein [Fibrobacter succinogenes]|uniref:ribonuclease H1 domain-containing protein n=1 Tax=Fibrobacter succinogenes TaxID=833 RepID=UPI001563B996|nr:ribonuclease H family protein [Fibrobacter succinogenes]